MGHPFNGFAIGGYVCGFSIKGTPAWILCWESVGTWSFEILVEDCDTGGPSSIAVWIKSLFTVFVLIPICKLCLKDDEGETESIIKWGGWGKVAYMEKMKENLAMIN